MRNRRIIFLNRYFYPDHSATSQMLSDLAFALAESGLEVMVVTSRQRYDDPHVRSAPHETVRGVEIRRVWTSRFGRRRLVTRLVDYATFYLSAFSTLLGACRRGDVLVAKTDPPMICVVTAIVGWLKGAVTVNWLQDVFPEVAAKLGVMSAGNPVFRILLRIRDRCLQGACANIVVGDLMAEHIARRGVARETIRVIHNWADDASTRPLESCENSLRVRLMLENRFVVGYSGNLGRAHDFETLLDAAVRLRADSRIAFVMTGGGAKYESLRADAARHGLSNIIFLPYQPRESLQLVLTLSDIHLVSLLPELERLVVPSKVYGVMAAGRPVVFVGSADGEVAKVIRRARCGTCVEPGNGAELAAVIGRCAADPAFVRSLGSAARTAYERDFDFSDARRKWTSVFDSVGPLAQRSAAGRPHVTAQFATK
jgi:glycosyltransferase involved in cell wall biosynthesis